MPSNCPPQPNSVSRSPPRFIFPWIIPSAFIHPFIAACMALLDSFSTVDDSGPFHNTSTISVSWSGLYCFALRPEYCTPPTPLTVLGKVSRSSLLFSVMVNAAHACCVSLFSEQVRTRGSSLACVRACVGQSCLFSGCSVKYKVTSPLLKTSLQNSRSRSIGPYLPLLLLPLFFSRVHAVTLSVQCSNYHPASRKRWRQSCVVPSANSREQK